jgi:hypothetical protein
MQRRNAAPAATVMTPIARWKRRTTSKVRELLTATSRER